MKKFLNALIWIAILGGIGYGIYISLPEYPQSFVKAFIQPITNAQAKLRINQIKGLSVGKVGEIPKDTTYQTVLERNTGMSAWIYEVRENEPGCEYVIYYGKGAPINLKGFREYEGKLSTSSYVKFEFKIENNKIAKVYPYIDGKPMFKGVDKKTEGLYKKQDAEILNSILQQLLNGLKSE